MMKIDKNEYIEAILKSKIILIGEKHGIASNYNLIIDNIREILESTNKKINIIIEIGYSIGILMDKYINNEYDHINEIFQMFKNTVICCNEFKVFLNNIKTINKGNINIVGIDIEHDFEKVEKLLLNNNIFNSEQVENIKKNIEFAKECYGKDEDLQFEILREKYLTDNFIKYIGDNNEYISIGFLGMYHVYDYMTSNHNTNPLVQNLLKVFKDTEITTCELKYINCKRLIKDIEGFKIIYINDNDIDIEEYDVTEVEYFKNRENRYVILIKNSESVNII